MNNTLKNKTLLIFTISFIIIVAMLTISLLEVYSICSSENTNEIKEKIADETTNNNIKNEIIKEPINKLVTLEEKVEIPEETIEEIVEEQEQPINKVYTYTANNGEKCDKIGDLKIPSLSIEYPILSRDTEELRKVSLTKYWGGNINEVGNLCILGHNYKDSRFFGKLPNIQKNAIIQITDLSGRTLEYKVYETAIIDPNDTSCTSQLTNGNTEITLITCYYEKGNAHATKRFIVKARA